MKTNFTQRKFYIVYFLLLTAVFLSRKSFAQCGSAGGNGAILTTNSIVIDGNMSDWTSILNDPDNNTWDATPDLDAATITNSGRDLLRFAFAPGSAGLYFYFSRAAASSNTVDFLVYLDVNNNNLMESNEPVFDISWWGNNGKTIIDVYNYTPYNATGDPLVSNGKTDGYTLPGTLGSTARISIGKNNAIGSTDKISLEALIPWSYITQTNASNVAISSLTYGMPFKFHVSSLSGTPSTVPTAGSVEDNFGGCTAGIIQNSGSLPIVLSYFNAYAQDAKVILNWVTEMEENNAYYSVERSQDGINFTTIGMVLGSMNSSLRKTYEYKDDLKGVDVNKNIYYRVKQTDVDGKSTYTPVRLVKLTQKQNMIQVNPNPFVDNLTVKYMSNVSGVMDIKVINANGQLVAAKKNTISKGFNSVSVNNLGSLARGLYVIQVMINGEISEQTKLLKN